MAVKRRLQLAVTWLPRGWFGRTKGGSADPALWPPAPSDAPSLPLDGLDAWVQVLVGDLVYGCGPMDPSEVKFSPLIKPTCIHG